MTRRFPPPARARASASKLPCHPCHRVTTGLFSVSLPCHHRVTLPGQGLGAGLPPALGVVALRHPAEVVEDGGNASLLLGTEAVDRGPARLLWPFLADDRWFEFVTEHVDGDVDQGRPLRHVQD